MADFTEAQISGPQGSPVTAQAPVSKPSIVPTVSNILTSIFDSSRNEVSATQANKDFENRVVGDFVSEMSVLADGVDSNELSREEASARSRALLTRTLASYPKNSKAILAASSSFVSSGIGKAISEGSFQEKLEIDEIEKAAQAGYVQPYMSEEERELGISHYRESQATKALNEAKRSRITLESSELALSEAQAARDLRVSRAGQEDVKFNASVDSAVFNAQSAKLSLSEAQRKNKAENIKRQQHSLVAEFADNSFFTTRARIRQVYEDVNNGLDPEVGRQRLLSLKADTSQVVTQMGRDLERTTIDSLAYPVNQLIDQSLVNLSSENRTQLLEDSVKRWKAVSTANLVNNDPELSRIYTFTTMFGANSAAMVESIGNQASIYMRNNATKEGAPASLVENQIGSTDSVTAYLEFVKGGLTKLSDGSSPDGKKADPEEVATHVTNILDGTNKHGPTANSLVEIKRTIDFYSSPQFAEYLHNNRESLDPQVIRDTADFIAKRIKDELAPAVAEDFAKAMSDNNQDIFLGNVRGIEAGDVTLETRGNQVLFVGKDSKASTATETFQDPKAIAERLNKKYSAALTKTILAEANLSNQTFKEAFDGVKPFIIPDQAKEKGTSIDDAVAELMADPDIQAQNFTEEEVRKFVEEQVK